MLRRGFFVLGEGGGQNHTLLLPQLFCGLVCEVTSVCTINIQKQAGRQVGRHTRTHVTFK